MADPTPLKVGIVGTGGMGRHHCDRFNEIPGVKVVAVHDVDAARAAEVAAKYQVPLVARTLDELLDAVDVVSVVTPDRFHAGPAIAALERGKHLLCEKPLSPTLSEAREMARVARDAAKRGVVNMVNFSYRGSGGFAKAIELARGGAIGQLRQVHSWYQQGWLSTARYALDAKVDALWRLSTGAGSGGVLGDLGCHILDMTSAIGGDIARARCTLRTFDKRLADGRWARSLNGVDLDANDLALIECDFVDGAFGMVQTSRWATGHGNHLRCEAHGVDGALCVDLDKHWSQVDVCTAAAMAKNGWSPEWTTEKTPDRANNWWRFIDAIRGKGPVDVDMTRGAQVQAYLDACERSAVSGNWETIADWM